MVAEAECQAHLAQDQRAVDAASMVATSARTNVSSADAEHAAQFRLPPDTR
jgi:hypothetical protein